jgi:hypothetical protein
MSRLAAAGAILILASGLAACGSSGAGKPAAGQRAQTPQQAIELAANISRSINTFAATVNVKVNSTAAGAAAAVNLTGTVTERLHPSLIAEADYSSFTAAGHSFPGGMSEVITPDSVYIKLSLLTQALHTSKPWIAIPLSALSKASGINLSSLFNELQTSSPLSQSQLFAGATNVRKVGTGTIDGVPVTEYSGSVSMAQALTRLHADLRSSLGSDIKKAGIKSAKFSEWLDAQNQVRKVIVTESGSQFSETISTTVSSINQPVHIRKPAAGQTTTLPASVLNQM